MKRLYSAASAVALSLSFVGIQSASAQPAETQMPKSALQDPIANEGVIEDEAVDALKEMSNFLMTANSLQIVSNGSLDVVTNSGQRIQLDGKTTYKVRKPAGFVIDYESDIKSRRFLYDGKNFTVYSPKLGFYSTVPAPATNREVTTSPLFRAELIEKIRQLGRRHKRPPAEARAPEAPVRPRALTGEARAAIKLRPYSATAPRVLLIGASTGGPQALTGLVAAFGASIDRVPVLITQHGRPAAYLLDVETYGALNQRLRILEGIARGERAIEEGRILASSKARKRMARWLK